MSEPKKEPRKGSARAKLEAFEREQRMRSVLMKKLWVVWVFLIVVLAAFLVLNARSTDNRWFDLPEEVAAKLRSGKLDGLSSALSTDFVLRMGNGEVVDRTAFLSAVEAHGSVGAAVFATQPHAFSGGGERHALSFWVIYSRGDLKRPETIPFVGTWLVDAVAEKRGDEWRFVSATARESISAR